MLTKCIDEIKRRLCTKTKGIVDSLEEDFGVCAKELNGNGEQNDPENLNYISDKFTGKTELHSAQAF